METIIRPATPDSLRASRKTTSIYHPSPRKSEDWFTSWFNSPYYHLLYKNRDDKEARFFIDHLVRLLHLGPDSKILDLGCGRGRHAVYLSSTGADVTGLDIAGESIACARQYEHERLHFQVGDMREAYGEGVFSEILNLFTSFGYFAGDQDNLDVLCQAKRALRPDGKIVIDFLNTEKVIDTLVPFEIRRSQGIQFMITRGLEDGFIVKNIHVRENGATFHFQERVQALRLEDFLGYFQSIGLEVLHVFGDYALRPFDPSSSERLILVARKPSEC